MLPLILMLGTASFLRALGRRGVGPGRNWTQSLRRGMSVMFIVTGAAFFTSMQDDMVRMLPPETPAPRALVRVAGVVQVVGGVGLAVPAVRPIAAGVLAILIVAKLPANLRASREGLSIRGPLPTPPLARIPLAVLWLILLFRVGKRRARADGPV